MYFKVNKIRNKIHTMMKKYNTKGTKMNAHTHTHARTKENIESKTICLTKTRTRIDFFHLIKQNLMKCCLPNELQRNLTTVLPAKSDSDLMFLFTKLSGTYNR